MKIKNYIISIGNCVVICMLFFLLSIRDDTVGLTLLFIFGEIIITGYLVKNIKNKINTIKVNAINKMMTLLSVVLTLGFLYECSTGSRITDKTGDLLAVLLLIICVLIWLYDYWIKPFINKQ